MASFRKKKMACDPDSEKPPSTDDKVKSQLKNTIKASNEELKAALAKSQSPSAPADKGLIDRFLSLFSDVRAGEGVSALVLTLDVMLLLVAYYLLKVVREPLILASGGVAAKNYATIIQAVVLMLFVPLYALLTKRMERMRLVTLTHLFFAANLVLFWVLALFKVPGLGGAFFVWLGMFSLVIIAQFWSMANDLYTSEEGKRLFPVLGIGMSVGAVFGSKLADWILFIGEFNMMLVAAVLLVACLVLGWIGATRQGAARGAKAEDKPIGGKNGFALIFSNKYLLLIAGVIMVLNLVNTTGETILDLSQYKQIEAENPDYKGLQEKCDQGPESCAQSEDKAACEAEVEKSCDAAKKIVKGFVGPFRADFFFWVNLIGFLTQTFLVSRVFKYLGIKAALFTLPLIALVAYGGMVVIAAFAFVRIMKIAENSTDYSLYNTTKQALWLPTGREEKYNAKMTIDSFLVRVADMASSGVSLLFLSLGFGIATYAASNVALIFVWLLLAWLIGRENEKRTAEAEKKSA